MTKLNMFLIALCVCIVLLPARVDPAIWLKKMATKWGKKNGNDR